MPEIEAHRDEFNEAIQKVLSHGRFILGPEVEEFERNAADYLGVKHVAGVNSGTDALVIALRAAGVGPGDEVITTPFSFFATAESISIVGARPVFTDINPQTFNLDPSKLEAAVTGSTKAVLPVHLFGLPADTTAIMEVARRHGLIVIEDCAQSFGAVDPGTGRQTGATGTAGAFSFFPTKNLGGFGDGGLIATGDDRLAGTSRMLRAHGGKDKYRNEMLGYNSRLDTLQAAVLNVKLKYIDRYNKARREAAARYTEPLAGVEGIDVPASSEGHVFHQYTVRVKDGRRAPLQEFLKRKGIGTGIYYPVPQDRLPVYEGQYEPCPVAMQAAREVLSLPIWPLIRPSQQQKVIDAIQAFF